MRPTFLRLGAAVALTFATCRADVPTADVVARVNGQAVTKQAFEDVVARDLKRYGEQRQSLPEGVVARIQEAVLHALVEDCIVAQRAGQEGLAVTEAELDDKLRQHQGRFRSQEAYQDYLVRANTDEGQLRGELRRSLLRDRLVDKLGGPVEPSTHDIQRYYDDNPEHFTEFEQMRVRRLYLALPKDGAAHKTRAIHKQARALYERAKRHPDDFASLCRQHSDAPEADRDGDLGLILAGRLPEVDKLVAAGLRPGQISEPVHLPHGVAIFRLDSHTPRQLRPLAEVEPQIRTTLLMHLRNERRQQVMQALRAEAKVDLLLHLGRRQRPGQGASPGPEAPAPADAAIPPRQEIGQAFPQPTGQFG